MLDFVVNTILTIPFLFYPFDPNPNVSHVSWEGEGKMLQEDSSGLKTYQESQG